MVHGICGKVLGLILIFGKLGKAWDGKVIWDLRDVESGIREIAWSGTVSWHLLTKCHRFQAVYRQVLRSSDNSWQTSEPLPCYPLQRLTQQWFCDFHLNFWELPWQANLTCTYLYLPLSSNQSNSLILLTRRPVNFTFPHRAILHQVCQLWDSPKNLPTYPMHLSWHPWLWYLLYSLHVSFHSTPLKRYIQWSPTWSKIQFELFGVIQWYSIHQNGPFQIRIGFPCQANVDLIVYSVLLRFYLL